MIKSISKCLFSAGIVLLAACSLGETANAQQLTPPAISSRFTLHNWVTGLCLAVSNNDTSPGGQIETWGCNGTVSQLWSQGDPTAEGSLGGNQAYTLESWVLNCRGCAPLVAGVQGGVIQDATPVITWTEDPTNFGQVEGTDNQGWAMIYYTNDSNGHACYYLANAGVNREDWFVMGVQGANTAQGTPIVIWQDVNSNGFPNGPYADQLWCLY